MPVVMFAAYGSQATVDRVSDVEALTIQVTPVELLRIEHTLGFVSPLETEQSRIGLVFSRIWFARRYVEQVPMVATLCCTLALTGARFTAGNCCARLRHERS
eukprot:6181775-Pleurochrysis_carterae.AAC.1